MPDEHEIVTCSLLQSQNVKTAPPLVARRRRLPCSSLATARALPHLPDPGADVGGE
jgi:hypothetical protein